MFQQGEAGEQAADKSRAGCGAGRLESLRLCGVHQKFGGHLTAARLQRVTQWQWEFRETAIVVLGEFDPPAHLGGIYGQRRRGLAFAGTEIIEAAGIGKYKGVTAPTQRRIHAVGLHHRGADQRRVSVHVIHGGKEREVALTLDDPEGEAAPLQRTRDGHDMSVYLVDRHVAMGDRREFNVSGIADGVPDEL
ncbi:hypothetical protein ATCCBAA256_00940 [Mycobacterium montefiorense]|nr:hypothetical protein ATCCBAA256_00940 [Mycobacterium montefiorense]